MTRSELDTLRAEYLKMVPADFIRGAFFSKSQIETLLNSHSDASGLFFYIIPDKSGRAKFTMYAEAFDANGKPYPDAPQQGLMDGDGSSSFEEGAACPPRDNCPNEN